MKDLNWLELINRLYIVVWVVVSWLGIGVVADRSKDILTGAIGVIAVCVAPYILRAVVRWVYVGLQTKKTG